MSEASGIASLNKRRYPDNPDYGSGVFRRRIRLSAEAGVVIGEMEDCSHGFRCRVLHDQQRVIAIESEAIRFPFSSCGGAVEPIKALEGMALPASFADVVGQGDQFSNCTHLFDLVALAIEHAAQPEGLVRQWDVAVNDRNVEGLEEALVTLNGETVLHWMVREWTVETPVRLAGKTLFRGFTAWALKELSGIEREAAFVLQKSYLVAQARKIDLNTSVGDKAIEDHHMHGACFTYSHGRMESAQRLANTTRDFTDCEEQLLAFK